MSHELVERIERLVEHAGSGEARKIAREAGVHECTLSRFRAGVYRVKSNRVAGLIAEAVKTREAAHEIMSGTLKPYWLVSLPRGLRIISKIETVEKIKQKHPDAHVLQIWRGNNPKEIVVVDVGE
jgi:hypothetical protein